MLAPAGQCAPVLAAPRRQVSSASRSSSSLQRPMTAVPRDLDDYRAANDERIRRELFDLLAIPSVSARSEHDADTRRTAEWVAKSLRSAGLTAAVHETAGHPVVVGEYRGAPAGAPTVLVYGHYDVQPAEPLDLWTSPPFAPTIRDGRIYARGSVDDKGQLFLHLKALEAHLAVRGRLPVNVIVLAEGEEEIGSEHLTPFVEAHAELLRCDAVVISDSAMFAPGLPSVLSSLRGLAYFQIDVQGPAQDLHSGSYGGAVVNPAMALARILATMHDADGRVAIAGFYDAVREWPAPVREQMRGLPFEEEAFREETGAVALGGERGYTVLEQLWTRPTCEVNGLLSGYTGEGDGEGQLPARPRPGPRGDRATDARARAAGVAGRRAGEGDPPPRRPPVASRARWPAVRRRPPRARRRVRPRAGDHG